MPRRENQIETLEARVAELSERVLLIEAEVRGSAPAEPAPPARSLRRATARRASKRRALARTLKPDTKSLVLEYLAKHPEATAGEIAKGLDVNRSTVSSSLAALLKLRLVRKADRGYEVEAR
jgi:DNA-binding transcriptional ArsR family regulator